MKDWGERFQTTTTEHRAALNLPPNRKEPAGASVGEELKSDIYDELAREWMEGDEEDRHYAHNVVALATHFRNGLSAERDAMVAAAYEQAAQQADDWIINPPPFKPDNLTGAIAAAKLIAEHIRTLTTADALAQREREIAKARLEEAKWWRHLVIMDDESYFAVEGDKRIAALEGKGS